LGDGRRWEWWWCGEETVEVIRASTVLSIRPALEWGSAGSRNPQVRRVILRMFHVTACFFAFFAGWRYMKKLQDPRLIVPGIFDQTPQCDHPADPCHLHCAGRIGKVSRGFWKVLFSKSCKNLTNCWISSPKPPLLNQFLYRYRE